MSAEDNEDNPHEESDYNAKLDFFSEQFDPLLALSTPDIVPPVENVKVYDNIHIYKSTKENRNANVKKKPAKDEEVASCSHTRTWEPHQLPVQSTRNKKKKNVLTRMDKIEGPLNLLRTCKDKRLKIKIWTRHDRGIRGYCTAFVVAFDKHWNLALEDVTEIWKRKRKRKAAAVAYPNNLVIEPKILPPKITILKTTKKTETCSRHLDQLMMRGEHVALISVISNSD